MIGGVGMWFDGVRQPDTQYVLSLSYGKDSMACIHVIVDLLKWPLDRIVTADIWATDEISACLPPVEEFKHYADKWIFEKYGIQVEHFCATTTTDKKCSHSVNVERERENPLDRGGNRKTFEGQFYSAYKRNAVYKNSVAGKTAEICGWPVRWIPWCNSRLKTAAITRSHNPHIRGFVLSEENGKSEIPGNNLRLPDSQQPEMQMLEVGHTRLADEKREINGQLLHERSKTQFLGKRQNEAQAKNIVHYVGIAADEPLRIKRHLPKDDIVLPLVQAGWDEDMCGLWCQYSGVLSPSYEHGYRDGCWLCVNQGVDQLRRLRHDWPDLWELMLKWDDDSPVSFHADGRTVHDFDRRFQMEDDGVVDEKERWRWEWLDNPPGVQLDLFGEECYRNEAEL